MRRRVVVAEDDGVSAEFFCAGLAHLGEVLWADSADALAALLSTASVDLLVLDDRLGAARAGDLLGPLRGSQGDRLPILLVSAELSPSLAAERIAQGASACLAKPMSLARLLETVDRIVPGWRPAWDDDAAAHALGPNPDARHALRRMFLDELPAARASVRDALAAGDRAALRETLHRLRAACGFCGASELAATLDGLAAQRGTAQLQAFESACERLVSAGLAD